MKLNKMNRLGNMELEDLIYVAYFFKILHDKDILHDKIKKLLKEEMDNSQDMIRYFVLYNKDLDEFDQFEDKKLDETILEYHQIYRQKYQQNDQIEFPECGALTETRCLLLKTLLENVKPIEHFKNSLSHAFDEFEDAIGFKEFSHKRDLVLEAFIMLTQNTKDELINKLFEILYYFKKFKKLRHEKPDDFRQIYSKLLTNILIKGLILLRSECLEEQNELSVDDIER